ncbi:MAG: baseplate J/gp47 family protein [Promethearchaeota archaeon]
MPFQRDNLQTIINRIVSDFQTRITGANSLLRRSVLKIISRVNAGAFHLLYEYLDFQYRQIFITTADADGLEVHSSEYGLPRKDATKAIGKAEVTGTIAAILPADGQLKSPNGLFYTIDTEVIMTSTTATIDVTALIAGEAGNNDAGTTLTFVTPILGVNSTAIVDTNALSGGANQETDDSLRERILERKRNPPHGGTAFDYVNWMFEVSGVTRAWAESLYQGLGTIGLSFVRDNDTNILPTLTQKEAVRAYIVTHEDPGTGIDVGCPVTAEPGLYMIDLEFLTINMTIKLYPNTSAIQTAIENNLENLILREGGPGQTIYLSRIREAICLAEDEERHSLTSPIADITAATNQVHSLGNLTFWDY